MYAELKQYILELKEEYNQFPQSEVLEVERLMEVHYELYTEDDLVLLRTHRKALKKIKRAESKLKKRYAWDKKMEEAPTHLAKLNEMVKQSTKLFCMDLEFCERSGVLTEVGVGTYNPQNNQMDMYHFVVLEHYDRRNGRHVPDHKDDFQYGQSQVLPLELVEVAVKTLLVGTDYLVGHAFANDKAFLAQCGYFENTKVLDTQKYAPYSLKVNQQMSLTNIVRETLEEEPEFLHNGGNDAYYTLKSLLKMAEVA